MAKEAERMEETTMRRYENPEFHQLYRDGKTYVQIAEHFGVSIRSVEDWIKSAIHTGLVERRKKIRSPLCGMPKPDETTVQTVKMMRERGELAHVIAAAVGKSISSIYDIFLKHGIKRPSFVPRTITLDKVEAVRSLSSEGKTIREVSALTGLSDSAVRRTREKLGIRSDKRAPQPARKLTPDKERLMLELWAQKVGPTEIARRLDVSRSAVEAKANRLNLPRFGKELKTVRNFSHLHTPAARAKAAETRRNTIPKSRPQFSAKVVPVEVIPETARPWLTRLRGECSYPYGPRGQIHSCCKPVWRETTYCEGHAGLCFEQKKAA